MSGNTIGSLVGGAIGLAFGAPQLGFALGGALGGYIAPTKIKGPRLQDTQQQLSQEGAFIPFGYGTFPSPTQVVWQGPVVEHKKKSGGKGGGGVQQISYTYTRSYAIGVCEGEADVVKLWRNGKLVYDITPTSTITGNNAKWLAKCTFYRGDETQLVDPVIEAVEGVGNTGPMRGLCYFVVEDDETQAGEIAQYRAVVQKCGTRTSTAFPTPVGWWKLDEASGTTATDSSGNGNHGTYVGNYAHSPAFTSNSTGCLECVDKTGGVYIANAALLDVGTNSDTWSVAASFVQDSFASDGTVTNQIVTNWGNATFGYHNWSLYLDPTSHLPTASFTKMDTTPNGAQGAVAIAVDDVHRLFGVRSGANIYLYLDGVLAATAAAVAGQYSWDGGANGIRIGAANLFGDSYGFVGRISDVMVFDVNVSAAQVEADAAHFGVLVGAQAVPDAPGIFVDEDGNLITAYYAGSEISACGAYLNDILGDLCERGGIDATEYDASALSAVFVKGYPCATEGSPQSFIEPLTQAFFFDRGEWDKKIRFIPRGGASAFALTADDLVARDGPAIGQTKIQEVELLRKVSVITVDPAADYSPKPQVWERRSGTVQAKGESTVEIPIVTDADTAKQIAHKRSNVAWSETEKFNFGLTRKWSKLTPTDVGTLTDKQGAVHRIRLQDTNESAGVFMVEEAPKDRASAYGSTATGTVHTPPTTTTPGLRGPTLFAAMALPMLRSSDNSPGFYIGACGVLDGWQGCVVLMSVDGGLSYQTALTITEPTIMGTLTAACTTSSTPIAVRVFGTLESKTTAQVALGQNWSAIASVGGTAEIIGHETATSTGTRTYNLTVLTRGLDETVAAAHASGDQFMDLATAYFLPIPQSYAGGNILFKAVGFGVSADAVDPITVPFEGTTYIIDGGGA